MPSTKDKARLAILNTLLRSDRDAHDEDSAVLADQVVADLAAAGLLHEVPSEDEFDRWMNETLPTDEMGTTGGLRTGAVLADKFVRDWKGE